MIQQQNLFDYLLLNFDIRLAIDESNHINIAYCRSKVDTPVKRLDEFKDKSLSECFPDEFASLFQAEIEPVFTFPYSNVGLLKCNYNGKPYTVHFDFVEFPKGFASGRISLTGTETRTDWLILQRNLAWRISEASDLNAIFAYVLRTATLSGYMDGGGVYLFNDEFTRLDLQYHLGLPEEFVERVKSFTPESLEWQSVLTGQPVYLDGLNLAENIKEKLEKEGLKTFASIPLIDDGQVIGAMNLASYSSKFISVIHKRYMEDLASILTDSIKRMKRKQTADNGLENYRQSIETFPDHVVVIDFNGIIKYVNQRLCQRLGYFPAELQGENISRIFNLDGQISMINLINDLTQKENSQFNQSMVTKTGEVIDMEILSSHSKWDLQNTLILSCREKNIRVDIQNFNVSDHFEKMIEMIPIPALIVEAATLEIKHANQLCRNKIGQFERETRSKSFINLFDQFEHDRLSTIIRQQGISGLTTRPDWALKQNDGTTLNAALEVIRLPWFEKETCLIYINPQPMVSFSNNFNP